jgi:hypothetical protein
MAAQVVVDVDVEKEAVRCDERKKAEERATRPRRRGAILERMLREIL